MGPDRKAWVEEAAQDEEYLVAVIHGREIVEVSRGKRYLVMMKRKREKERKGSEEKKRFFILFF